jgi:predicted lipoprotein with Yx(FWY)xxD motif
MWVEVRQTVFIPGRSNRHMAPTRRELLGAAGASLALAGCLGGIEGGSGGNDQTGTGTVQVRSHDDFGDILVDADGMTLYRFDADEAGSAASACHDDCADAWPPLTVSGDPTAGSGVSASLSTFDRDDGSTQVTADGWPLYYFASDGSPGDVAGQGLNEVWWVVAPDGSKITAAADDDSGRTY